MQEKALVLVPKEEFSTPSFTGLLLVLNKRLSEDLPEEISDPVGLEKIKRQRLKIYLDAIKRGYPKVLRKLGEEGLEFKAFGGNANIFYRLWYGIIDWSIVPTSQDLFTRAKFFKYLKDQELEPKGITEFLDDTLLTETALQEGTNEQDSLFSHFESAASSFKHLLLQSRSELDCLPSVKPEILSVIKKYDEITKGLAKKQDRKTVFLERLAEGNIGLTFIETLENYHPQIQALSTFFEKGGVPLDPYKGERGTWERTFLAELVTNPKDVFENMQTPSTEYERIIKFHQLITKALEFPKNERLENLYLIIEYIFSKNDDGFNKFFDNCGISREIGLEYYRNLFFKRVLKDWAGKDNYGVNYLRDYEREGLWNLNSSYLVGKKEFAQKQELRVQTILDPRRITESLLSRRRFPLSYFCSLEKTKRISTLRQIFASKNQQEKGKFIENEQQYTQCVEAILNSVP